MKSINAQGLPVMSSKLADLFTQVDPFTYRSKLKDDPLFLSYRPMLR